MEQFHRAIEKSIITIKDEIHFASLEDFPLLKKLLTIMIEIRSPKMFTSQIKAEISSIVRGCRGDNPEIFREWLGEILDFLIYYLPNDGTIDTQIKNLKYLHLFALLILNVDNPGADIDRSYHEAEQIIMK